ncbi:MAG: MFS transporter [Balneolales bacterium]
MLSAFITVCAGFIGDPFWVLFIGTFILALSNGVVEAVINPITSTLYSKQKTHYLNVLHAGWPGGLVLAGLLMITLGDTGWRWKVLLVLLPTAIYGIMLLREKFPVQERVAAGVPYTDMLKEFRRPLVIILMLIMFPLAITELGTDSWITALMENVLQDIHPGWILVYTSLIMFVLRFFAGPIVHYINPIGLLACSAAIACVGLIWLSVANVAVLSIFLAATLYGIGKSFAWATMIGVVAEQSPKGGALTLNTLTAVGMFAVGVLGTPVLGSIQDHTIDQELLQRDAELYAIVTSEPVLGILGSYRPLDRERVEILPEEQKKVVREVQGRSSQTALARVAIMPALMTLSFIALLIYFRLKGGYKPVELETKFDE